MATNILYDHGDQLALTPTAHIGAGSNPQSGDPVIVGALPGVALTDQQSDGTNTVKLNGVGQLSVDGQASSGTATAVSEGDTVYFDSADGQINVDATNGTRYGYALAPVASGSTATIPVKIGY